MKIAIVGTGAMGSVYAALLATGGHEVWAIDERQDHLDAIEISGLTLTGASGTVLAPEIHVGRSPSDAGPCDLWIVATKAADAERAATAIAPLLQPESVIMAFQNGLGAGERLARVVPEEHILIGIAEGFGSSIPSPGHVHLNGMRLIRIGELHGGMTSRVEQMVEMWRAAGFNVRGFSDIGQMIWEKFLCNVTLSAPCAAFDVTVGELMSDAETWAVAIGCMLEAYRLASAMDISFSFDDPVRYVTDFSATIPNASPSMRLDHLSGHRSEIDVINGQVVELSRTLGLDTPYNETVCAVVRTRESRFG